MQSYFLAAPLFAFASLGAKTCLIRGQWGQGGATSLDQHACGSLNTCGQARLIHQEWTLAAPTYFRVTYRANSRGKTRRTGFLLLFRAKRSSSVSPLCAMSSLWFRWRSFRPVPVSTYPHAISRLCGCGILGKSRCPGR